MAPDAAAGPAPETIGFLTYLAGGCLAVIVVLIAIISRGHPHLTERQLAAEFWYLYAGAVLLLILVFMLGSWKAALESG